eukprot:4845005-Lingulodinium_polyedra.AAC.1
MHNNAHAATRTIAFTTTHQCTTMHKQQYTTMHNKAKPTHNNAHTTVHNNTTQQAIVPLSSFFLFPPSA